MLACRVVGPDGWCRRCRWGIPGDTLTRRLAHEPFRVAPHDAADPDPPLPLHRLRDVAPRHQQGRRAAGEAHAGSLRWALEGIVVQHLTIAHVAEGLGVSWNTANAAVLAEGQRYSSAILPGSTG